jgi:hypothetical protein
MKRFITMLVPLIWFLPVLAQPPINNAKPNTATKKYTTGLAFFLQLICRLIRI